MDIMDIYDKNRNLTGRTHRRGEPMKDGDYQLVVHVFIRNSDGRYLITKRAEKKTYPGRWEGTSGCVLTGETSLEAALREIREELGIELQGPSGKLVCSVEHPEFNGIGDVWLFCMDVKLGDIALQEEEACDVKWADSGEIREMLASGRFVPAEGYIEEVFAEVMAAVFFPDKVSARTSFSVIAARYDGKWVFVRKKGYETYEIPGGHIESGENEEAAARRELYEESGATEFSIQKICAYGVTWGKERSYGALFYAEIEKFGEMPDYEMEERVMLDFLPDRLSYPYIQPALFERAEIFREGRA